METAQLLKVLLSWAVTLSSYSAPAQLPAVEYKPETYFHEQACGGRPCSILAWYDNNGTIYMDDRLSQQTDVMTRSMLVHEIVHYLQDLSGKFDNTNCEDHARREREAYAIQREYGIRASGSVLFIRIVIPPCPQA
ncbi:MAG: hypothetical protein V3R41_07715 [Gammaproteobacteria bacterium]